MLKGNENGTGMMTQHNLNLIRSEIGIKTGFSVEVDVFNFLSDEITIMDSHFNRHEMINQRNWELGKVLIVKIVVYGARNVVKINAGCNYSEEYFPPTLEKYKDSCLYFVTPMKGVVGRPNSVEYVLSFGEKQLEALDNKIEIIETGTKIISGKEKEKKQSKADYWTERLRPRLTPTDDLRNSGLVIVANDPNKIFDRLFFKMGNKVHEIEIDRNPKDPSVLFIGSWNQLNQFNDPVEEQITEVSFEEGLSGKNDLGIKIYRSISEALNDGKEKEKEKKEEKWAEKESKMKYLQQWVKVGIDCLKNFLPATIAVGKALFSMWRKSKGLP